MNGPRFLAVALVVILAAAAAPAWSTEDDDLVWNAFLEWFKTAPEKSTLKEYAAELEKAGLAAEEAQRRVAVIRSVLSEQPERGIEATYDRIFSQPLTGDPEEDGFTSTPSAFMVESVGELKPGAALDVGAGQGRNAGWLARQGWDVTAIDLSGAGLAAASRSAEEAGVRISTVKTAYEDFDFGTERWDLILMILSWAPVSDEEFVAGLREALRPGGVLVFEHVIDKPEEPFPPYVHALQPGVLRTYFDDFLIDYYDESERLGDWGGPPTPIVRMIARRQ